MSKYVNTNKDIAGKENLTRFEGFYKNRYVEPFVAGYVFMFMTKPSLFLSTVPSETDYLQDIAYSNMQKDQYLSQFIKSQALNENDEILSTQLMYNSNEILTDVAAINFLPIITNRARSIDIMDVSLDNATAFNTRYGYNMPLPRNTIASSASGTVNIGFTETMNLDVLKMIGIWIRYMEGISDGSFRANPEMIKKGIVDYMSSIYYFVLEPDGRTLKYWSKLTGVWPQSIPYNIFSWNKGSRDIAEIDVSFNYTIKEDMNIQILEDFNRVSLNMTENEWSNLMRTTYMETFESPIRANPILRKENLKVLIDQHYPESSDKRQPLVFLDIPQTKHDGDDLEYKFRLSFARGDMGHDYLREITGEGYFYDRSYYHEDLDEEGSD